MLSFQAGETTNANHVILNLIAISMEASIFIIGLLILWRMYQLKRHLQPMRPRFPRKNKMKIRGADYTPLKVEILL
jgi:hypothetical protein